MWMTIFFAKTKESNFKFYNQQHAVGTQYWKTWKMFDKTTLFIPTSDRPTNGKHDLSISYLRNNRRRLRTHRTRPMADFPHNLF